MVVFAGGRPASVTLPLVEGALEIGRELLVNAGTDDDAMSRTRALVAFDGRRWTVRDLGSRNGTFVDGARTKEVTCAHDPVIRLGRVLALPTHDAPSTAGVQAQDRVTIGPGLREAYLEIARAASFGHVVHLIGESGSGKELAARHFHSSGPRKAGPFVAVNCATIPEGLAERLLFGAVRGAYSGADTSSDGWVQAADHGTLFLDEIAELDLAVQAKLLRVLETREVTALGASRGRAVDFGLCSATHGDLRTLASERRFREDLYFRLGRPSVRIPALRERRDEIPFHLEQALVSVSTALTMDPAFVEACLLRHWPGNVRELVQEGAFAARRAHAEARSVVGRDDLAVDAGHAMSERTPARDLSAPGDLPKGEPPPRAAIEAALLEHRGNVTAAARALGMHRNQLRRWVEKEGVHLPSFSRESGPGVDE